LRLRKQVVELSLALSYLLFCLLNFVLSRNNLHISSDDLLVM
jgi:hypothetical protein